MDKIISDLASRLNNSVTYFLHGGCYIFAKQLRDTIGGDLFYLLDDYHFVVKVDDKFYDASGNVTKKYRDSRMITESEFLKRSKLNNQIRC